MSEDLRFPIGRFNWPAEVSDEDRKRHIDAVESAPRRLREAVAGLTAAQFDTPYREGGWTVRQVVHHVPDSHMNNYVRFKLALTEAEPVIKPYDEAAWAALADSFDTPIETSLCLLECLHARWVSLLRSLSAEDWKKRFRHPELGAVTLDSNLALYAWHGDHHIAHIAALRRRNGW